MEMYLQVLKIASKERSNHENGYIHRCSGIILMAVSVRYSVVGSNERAKGRKEEFSSRTYQQWPICRSMCQRTLNRQDAKGIRLICEWLASLRWLITKGYHCLMSSQELVI